MDIKKAMDVCLDILEDELKLSNEMEEWEEECDKELRESLEVVIAYLKDLRGDMN